MKDSLINAWERKFSPLPVIEARGVLSVSFSYWRGFGGRIVAGDVTLSIGGNVEKPSFRSETKWPHENLENYVIDGITDAMHQFTGAPVGVTVTLTDVGWHEVNSCGSGFYFAAREAMFSAFRILRVPKEHV